MLDPSHFQLRFRSLFKPGKDLAFPCDEAGNVDIATLSKQAQETLRLARSMVGREYAIPIVQDDIAGLG